MWQHCLHWVQSTFDIKIESPVEQIVIDFKKFCASYCCSRRIEEELHAAETIDGELNHIFNCRSLGYIDSQRQHLTADRIDLLGGFLDAFLIDIDAYDIGFLPCEDQCRGAANPAGRAGDYDSLSREIVRCFRHELFSGHATTAHHGLPDRARQ